MIGLDILSGILSIILMVGLGFYGVRRRSMNLRWGPARMWRRLHLWGGGVFLVVMTWHGGLSFPEGHLNGWLWILTIWVVLSGLAGMAVQKWIPRTLAQGLSLDVVYERIPEIVTDLHARAESLVNEGPEPLRTLYRNHLAASMAAPANNLSYFLDVTGGSRTKTSEFEFLYRHAEPEHRAVVRELESLYKTKLECDAHYTLQKALRWWMWLHLPPSLAMMVLAALHTYLMLRY